MPVTITSSIRIPVPITIAASVFVVGMFTNIFVVVQEASPIVLQPSKTCLQPFSDSSYLASPAPAPQQKRKGTKTKRKKGPE